MEGDSKGRVTRLAERNISCTTLLNRGKQSKPAMLRYINEVACGRALLVNNIADGSDEEMKGNFKELD